MAVSLNKQFSLRTQYRKHRIVSVFTYKITRALAKKCDKLIFLCFRIWPYNKSRLLVRSAKNSTLYYNVKITCSPLSVNTLRSGYTLVWHGTKPEPTLGGRVIWGSRLCYALLKRPSHARRTRTPNVGSA